MSGSIWIDLKPGCNIAQIKWVSASVARGPVGAAQDRAATGGGVVVKRYDVGRAGLRCRQGRCDRRNRQQHAKYRLHATSLRRPTAYPFIRLSDADGPVNGQVLDKFWTRGIACAGVSCGLESPTGCWAGPCTIET